MIETLEVWMHLCFDPNHLRFYVFYVFTFTVWWFWCQMCRDVSRWCRCSDSDPSSAFHGERLDGLENQLVIRKPGELEALIWAQTQIEESIGNSHHIYRYISLVRRCTEIVGWKRKLWEANRGTEPARAVMFGSAIWKAAALFSWIGAF